MVRKRGPSLVERRQFFRIVVDRMGYVERDGATVPCQVINLSQKGFKLVVHGTVSSGDVLHLQFRLGKEDLISCTVQVTYVKPPVLGAVIIEISGHYQTKLSRFVDEVNVLTMTGF